MAKECISCGKNIGFMTVRIPLLGNEEVVICSDCFKKMPPVLDDLYQKRIFPYKSELKAIKESVLADLKNKGYNIDTMNFVAKYFDEKIERTNDKPADDNSLVQKICPICKMKLGYETNPCSSCGYIFNEDILLNFTEIAEIYNNRATQYQNNPYYEYDYIVVKNNDDGTTNKEKISKIIEDHAFQGWRLITMYSNEIGKNGIAIGGAGVNATICEDILIFERCIKSGNV